MIFLHTSDWHLGATGGERDLWDDQKYFIDAICGIVREKNVDAVLLAGDVYDRSVPSAAAIGLYDYAMNRLCGELGVKVLIIAGNHDSAERLASCAGLLDKAGLYLQGAAQREPRVVEFADSQVFFLPWMTEEKIKSLYPEERDGINGLTEAYRVAVNHMREKFIPGKRHFLLAHAFITTQKPPPVTGRRRLALPPKCLPACLRALTMWRWDISTNPNRSIPSFATAAAPWRIPLARRSARKKA